MDTIFTWKNWLRIIKLENEFSYKIPIEASNEERELIELTKKYSMNGSLRIWTLITALKKFLKIISKETL